MIVTIMLLKLFVSEASADIFVSASSGDDSATGLTPATAVQSLGRAQSLWRRKTGFQRVYLSGNFFLNKTLMLWKIDSHVALQPWPASNKRTTPRLSGGIPVAHWKSVSAGIWQAETHAPATASSIFVTASNGTVQRRYRVRTQILFWDKPLSWVNKEISRWGFVYSPGDISENWDLSPTSIAQWRVIVFHQWSKSYHTVRAIFPHNRTILFRQPAPYFYGNFVNNTASAKRWYIENIPELVLEPGSGQWRITSSKLFYAPPTGEAPPQDGQVVVPVLQRLVSVQHAQNVAITGLGLTHTDVQCPSGDFPLGKEPVDLGGAKSPWTCDNEFADYTGELLFANDVKQLAVSNCSIQGSGGAALSVSRSPNASVSRVLVNLNPNPKP